MAKFTVDAKYLSHADISDTEDTVLTIKSYEQETMGQGTQQVEKWVLYFKEVKKGLGLNKTNGKMLCKLFNSDDMDDWTGHKIAIYVKDDVEFQGEIVSAIRVRHKLPGKKDETGEDLSTLTFDEVLDRVAQATGFKEMGLLVTHALTLRGTVSQMESLNQVKEDRIAALMSAGG